MADDEVMVVLIEEDGSGILVIMADEVMVVLIEEDGSGILMIMADDEVVVVPLKKMALEYS